MRWARLLVAGGLPALALLATTARAERPLYADQTPAEFEGVGISQHLDTTLPLDLRFTDERGRTVRLGDYFESGKPVILTPVYYNCPMLCTLVLNGMVDGLEQIEWTAGEEFEIVTFTVDETEGVELAERKKRAYLTQYQREPAQAGWHFLVGSKASIDTLTEAIGFQFKRQPNGDIAHSASVLFITPDGRISRYMNDVVFEPKDVRLALVEASQGTIGSPMEKFLLFTCFKFDPDANSYAVSAIKLMRLAGVVTILAIGTGLLVLWRRGARPPHAAVAIGGVEP